MKCLFYFLILASSAYAAISNPIDYGGMIINCEYDCNEPDDLYRIKIERTFAQCVKKVFLNCKILDRSLEFHSINPWGKPDDDNPFYDIWDWKVSKGIWPYEFDQLPRKNLNIMSHSTFQEIALAMREDLHFYYVEWPRQAIQKYNLVISKLKMIDPNNELEGKDEIWLYGRDIEDSPWGFIFDESHRREAKIKRIIQNLEDDILFINNMFIENDRYPEYCALVEEAIAKIDDLFKRMFTYCLRNHQIEGATFSAAIENLIMGEYEIGIGQIQFLINFAEEKNLGDQLLSKLYLLKGELQSEFSLFSDAIVGLTIAIQKDPSMRDAYLERAVAYFETGDFDKAIEDYLSYDPDLIDSKDKLAWRQIPQMAAGLASGMAKGGFGETVDFIPETMATAKGLGLGLWSCVKDPVGASVAFVDAANECIQYIRTHTCFEFIQDMVPELRELVQRYDELTGFQRGELIGTVIGKYGVDILCCKYSAKAIKAYKDLKRANQLMTLEVLASQKQKQEILEASKKFWTKRQDFLKTIPIELDKQGKHVVGHRNFIPSRSVWEFPIEETQKLINQFAGTGIKVRGETLGSSGYQEMVNFKVHVGRVVKKSGEEVPTTWGKIHYSNEGVHVVPCLPGE